MGNAIKTTLLLGIMTVLIVWIGHLFGGRQGTVPAFILAAAMNFFSYWYSDKIVLRMFIVNPLSGGSLMNLFSTHPPLEERIARLRGGQPSAPADMDDSGDRGRREAEKAWNRLSH
ncbi:MAG: hypothetical protein JRJ60_02460 [Deltaproteobacteria bacterium]|nr:hypothetical protein [Deltaproteobacteria bacterium]